LKLRVRDIAKAAGVSPATVDRVLNNRPGVHPRTTERVQQAVGRLSQLDAESLDHYLGGARRPKSVDFLIPTGTNVFLRSMAEEVDRKREEFALFGVEPRSHKLDSFDPKLIADRLRELALDSDGICVVAVDHPMVRAAITAAVDSGVPVVTLVTDISNSRQVSYVGIDNFAAGRTAGYLVGRFLAGRAGEVGLIAGSVTYRGHAEREQGFRSVLSEEFPQLSASSILEGNDDDELSFEQAKQLLRRKPKLLGLYNIGAGSAGVARALKEANRGDAVFIAHELNAITRTFLLDGVLDAIINQNFAIEVRNAIKIIMNYHAGRDLSSNTEPVPIEVFLRENLNW
jgi:LacI family transcriptional regulator